MSGTNKQLVDLLIDLLYKKKHHEGVVQVFKSFLVHYKATKDQRKPFSIILIDKVVESLHCMNTAKSMQKLCEMMT